ncbi:proteolipid protein M6-1, putative [Pediculus humanus corporis]|uniref:Proteolipid protein M6-1, putative n=1 Tax=Pediculus humanus subsp. corporis TaxID=121224 RepID=E0W493_PEDHC|nr:proteolipid protein M6-1, putative [Pediculus humanus corporis]EEB20449.1 proteolipid protein M6-1, putative [Pediculus humanus corporis]
MNGGEGRRSREAVRNSIRSYGVKVMDSASLPLKKNTKQTESQESVSRFSEKSLHSQYDIREGSCKEIVLRIPYGSLFGTFLCILGLVLAIISFTRITSLEEMMYKDVLKRDPEPELVRQIYSIVTYTLTGALAILSLIIGFLSTGDTRAEVHNTWKAKLGGRITCGILLFASFVLLFSWLMGCFYTGWGFNMHRIDRDNCDAYTNDKSRCLPIPFETDKRRRELCDGQEIKKFCKDYTEKALNSFAIFGCGSLFVTISMSIFICCLAANYTMIRLESKLQELEELGPRRF